MRISTCMWMLASLRNRARLRCAQCRGPQAAIREAIAGSGAAERGYVLKEKGTGEGCVYLLIRLLLRRQAFREPNHLVCVLEA